MLTDFDFFSIDNTQSIILIVLVIALAITFLKYISNYSKGNQPYHSQKYWDTRYSVISKRMDWYIPFEQIKTKFKLDNLLLKIGCNLKTWKVLDLGCGNSTMPIDVILDLISSMKMGFKMFLRLIFLQR
jgi:hypothetical protein